MCELLCPRPGLQFEDPALPLPQPKVPDAAADQPSERARDGRGVGEGRPTAGEYDISN